MANATEELNVDFYFNEIKSHMWKLATLLVYI